MVYIRMWSYTHALAPIYYCLVSLRSGIERGFFDIISVIRIAYIRYAVIIYIPLLNICFVFYNMVFIRMWSYTHALAPIYYSLIYIRSGIERGFIDIISVIQYRLNRLIV